MASTKPKRDLSDFFKPYARARFAEPAKVVPQKRPSPPPENDGSTLRLSQMDGPAPSKSLTPRKRPSTPPPKSQEGTRKTPERLGQYGATTPSSSKLAIRTPKSTRTGMEVAKEIEPVSYPHTSPQRPESASDLSPPPAIPMPAFSDISAEGLTEVPISTQSIVREGKVIAVRDSDEDDSDSIASLTDMFELRQDERDTTSLTGKSDPQKLETERLSTMKLFLNDKPDPGANKKRLRDILALKKSGTSNALKFLEHQRNDMKDAESLEALKKRYESTAREFDDSETAPVSNDDLLAHLENHIDDEASAEHILSAVRRTEALSVDTGYLYFGKSGMRNISEGSPPSTPFPDQAVPMNLWRAYDDDHRARVYQSGIVTHLAATKRTEEDALRWTFETFMEEPNLSLRLAYTKCLETAAPLWARNAIKPEDVQQCFWSLAASPDGMIHSKKVRLQPLVLPAPPLYPEYLASILDLFAKISAHMSFESLSVLASICCQLAVDYSLMSDPNISSAVEQLFEHLFGRYCEEEIALHVASYIVSTITQTFHEPTLQVRLLEHIRPTSNCALNLRITLAHRFLLGVPPSQADFTGTRPPQVNLSALTNLLTVSDDFATARLRTKLNYTDLRARTIILDMAIADGGRPASFPSAQYAKKSEFNLEIDRLAAAVRKTWVAISDTGASHMKRTEAKEKLDCVYHRLVYVVRTEPPRKKHSFDPKTGEFLDGEEVRARGRSRDSMKNFLRKAREARKSGLGSGISVENGEGEGLVVDKKRVEFAEVGKQEAIMDMDVKQQTAVQESDLLSPTPSAQIGRTSSGSTAEFVDALEQQQAAGAIGADDHDHVTAA